MDDSRRPGNTLLLIKYRPCHYNIIVVGYATNSAFAAVHVQAQDLPGLRISRSSNATGIRLTLLNADHTPYNTPYSHTPYTIDHTPYIHTRQLILLFI